jgi:CheY-like chemotaxis protein
MKKTILILDDEPMFLDWIEDYVESLGCKVKFVTTIDQACSELVANRYGAIIVDLQVPASERYESIIRGKEQVFHEFRGLYVAQHARNHSYNGSRILVYSVHNRPEIEEVCSRLDTFYVPKGRSRLMKERLDYFISAMNS